MEWAGNWKETKKADEMREFKKNYKKIEKSTP